MEFQHTVLAKKLPEKGTGLYYDPLYGYVPLPHYLREAMDLDIFQRLQGIKQLSTVYLTFRGAVHTRFAHSVGTAYLTSILFNRLKEVANESNQDENFPQMNPITEAAMGLAALFHDVGHGPFGHIFEMFCRRVPEFKDWTHEKMAKKLITGQDEKGRDIQEPAFTQIKSLLRRIHDKFNQSNSEVIENMELLKPINIYNIASGQAPVMNSAELSNKYFFLKDIIASSYGLDRLDYLRRDAYYSGVNTGNVDIGEIITNVIIKKHEGKYELFLKPECMPALETLLQARNLVYRRLYHNSVHRSAQELVIRGLIASHKNPDSMCLLTDDELLTKFSEWGGLMSRINEMIKFRVLDEKIRLCSHWDITDYKHELDTYKGERWLTLKGFEGDIATDAGMRNDSIFYDVEIVPAVQSQDFTAKIFFDSIGGRTKLKSLFDLAPHLKMIYGHDEARRYDGAKHFNESVSDIIVCFPYDAIAQDIKLLSIKQGDQLKTGIEELYKKRFEPLIKGFFVRILKLKENDLKAFDEKINYFECMKEKGVQYISGLIDQYQEND